MAITTEPAMLRLLQLASVSLPVGGYSFSQGMEYAVDSGWLKDKAAVTDWLRLQLCHSLAQLDLPVIFRVYAALDNKEQDQAETLNDLSVDDRNVTYWNDFIIACRETDELRMGDVAMGMAMVKLLNSLEVPLPFKTETFSFVVCFAIAARHWKISTSDCALAFSWSWLENQVAAATKLVPLGQTQAQQLLGDLQADIPEAIAKAQNLDDAELGAALPGLAIASALHETQYSRLFRS